MYNKSIGLMMLDNTQLGKNRAYYQSKSGKKMLKKQQKNERTKSLKRNF